MKCSKYPSVLSVHTCRWLSKFWTVLASDFCEKVVPDLLLCVLKLPDTIPTQRCIDRNSSSKQLLILPITCVVFLSVGCLDNKNFNRKIVIPTTKDGNKIWQIRTTRCLYLCDGNHVNILASKNNDETLLGAHFLWHTVSGNIHHTKPVTSARCNLQHVKLSQNLNLYTVKHATWNTKQCDTNHFV